jgi:hypothetical protein
MVESAFADFDLCENIVYRRLLVSIFHKELFGSIKYLVQPHIVFL